MARVRRTNGRGRPTGTGTSDADRIIDAALALIPTEGWRGLSLAAIAAAAGLPILQVYRLFRSKQAILGGLFRRIDEIVLADPPAPEPDERPRDRLFDLLMRRFDALQPYKAAIEVLRRELGRSRNRVLRRELVVALGAVGARSCRHINRRDSWCNNRQACHRGLSFDDASVAQRRFLRSRSYNGGTRRSPAPHRALFCASARGAQGRRASSRLNCCTAKIS